MYELSIVMPVYNAAKVLRKNVELVIGTLRKDKLEFEILIAEDGSSDGSNQIAAELAEKHKEIKLIHHDLRLGRGKALSYAFRLANGRYAIYLDADLEVPPEYICLVVRHLRLGHKIVIGSKRHPLAKTNSPLNRKFLSLAYNKLVRLVLKSKVFCHQTGLKGFERNTLLSLLELVKDNKWFWDTEVLVIAQWQGYTIKEIPVNCDYGFEGTTVNPIKTSCDMFKKVIQLRLEKSRLIKHHVL